MPEDFDMEGFPTLYGGYYAARRDLLSVSMPSLNSIYIPDDIIIIIIIHLFLYNY